MSQRRTTTTNNNKMTDASGGGMTTVVDNKEEAAPLFVNRNPAPPRSRSKSPSPSPPPSSSNGKAVRVVGTLSLDQGGSDDDDEAQTPAPSDNALLSSRRRHEFEQQYHQARVQHWIQSPWAVGLVERTWIQERVRSQRHYTRQFGDDELNPDDTGCLCCSACVCGMIGADRVGNMAVLRQSTEWVEQDVVETDEEEEETEEDEENLLSLEERRMNQAVRRKNRKTKLVRRRFTRPRLDCIVGPYWPMMLCVTYPLIFAVSGWTFVAKILPGKQPWWVNLGWTCLTSGLITALALTACRDPGIQYKVLHIPPSSPNNSGGWRWSDRAHSYRPGGRDAAYYDADTACIIEGFDHTCPWTGTAIGRKNMLTFQLFVCLVFVCMMMDIFVLTGIFEVMGGSGASLRAGAGAGPGSGGGGIGGSAAAGSGGGGK